MRFDCGNSNSHIQLNILCHHTQFLFKGLRGNTNVGKRFQRDQKLQAEITYASACRTHPRAFPSFGIGLVPPLFYADAPQQSISYFVYSTFKYYMRGMRCPAAPQSMFVYVPSPVFCDLLYANYMLRLPCLLKVE